MSLYLSKLHVQHLRLIESATLTLPPGRTALLGANASGKTSLLEAIYMLGTGRSFLTPQAAQAIQHEQPELTLFGALCNNQCGASGDCGESKDALVTRRDNSEPEVALGVRRDRSGGYTVRLNGENMSGASQLASLLPLQLITPDTLNFIVHGPKERRAYLDLGLFHTQPQFKDTIQEYRQYLKQRNAWLCSTRRGALSECVAWEAGLVKAGEQVTAMRIAYLKDLQEFFEPVAANMLGDLAIDIKLQQGWNSKLSLAEALEAGRTHDLMVGHTQAGPHRADLVFLANNRKAKEVLSRGQQKMLVCALKFAQEGLFRQISAGRSSLFLIDDIASELDDHHLTLVLQQITQLDSQALLTMLSHETYNKITSLAAQSPATTDFFSAVFTLQAGRFHNQVPRETCQPSC